MKTTRILFYIAGFSLLLFSLQGLWTTNSWIFDQISHFRFQVFLICVAVLLCSLYLKFFKLSALLILIVLLNMSHLNYFKSTPNTFNSSQKKYSLLFFNTLFLTDNSKQTLKHIQEKNPDFIALAEVTPIWKKTFTKLARKYPYYSFRCENGAFGMAFFSRYPAKLKLFHLASANPPAISAQLKLENKKLTLLLIHPVAPHRKLLFKIRNKLFKNLIKYRSSSAFILLGDFNLTPYSHFFQKIKNSLNLKDSREGFGRQASWPSMLPEFLRIPIDHFLLSPELTVLKREVGVDLASDHLPIYMEFSFKN